MNAPVGRERETVLRQEYSTSQFKACRVYFNRFFVCQQVLHGPVRNSGVSAVTAFEKILKVNLAFQNYGFTCICSRIFLSFQHAFGILLHLKMNFTSEAAPVKSCEAKEGTCGFNLNRFETKKRLIRFLQGELLQKLVGVWCRKRLIQAPSVAVTSLSQQLLICGLK